MPATCDKTAATPLVRQRRYRLNHGFNRYMENIPKVLIATTRGQSPRVIAISTEGIPPYYIFALKPWLKQFVARGNANQICLPPCVISIGIASGDYGSPMSFSFHTWRVGSGTRLTRRQPAPSSNSKGK